eukprot:291785_1
MKIVSIILLTFIIQLKANRLLQAQEFPSQISIIPCTCTSPITGECGQEAGCPNREYCQTTDPTSPFYITCNAYPNARCSFTGCGGCYEYFVDSFGKVVDCNTPVAGKSCGVQGEDCMALGAPAGLCSDGKTCFFNCGGCVYAENGNGNLVCSPQIISQDVCPVAGDICGTQGNECPAIRAAAFMCPDGITCYLNCGKCTWEDDGKGG